MIVFSRHYSKNLSTGDIDVSFDFPLSCKLLTVYVHSDVKITEEIDILFSSAEGSEYDTLIETRVLQNQKDYVFGASGAIAINENDRIRIKVTNANKTGIVGVTVKMEK